MKPKPEIHTTLEEDVKTWLENEAKRQDKYVGELIEDIVEFYKLHKELPEKYKHAELYLTDMIRQVLAEEKKKDIQNSVGFIRPRYAGR